jgi:hypothetical protein
MTVAARIAELPYCQNYVTLEHMTRISLAQYIHLPKIF